MDWVVDQWSWLEDLGQRQPPVRVGDRDEANMKVLACAADDRGLGDAAGAAARATATSRAQVL